MRRLTEAQNISKSSYNDNVINFSNIEDAPQKLIRKHVIKVKPTISIVNRWAKT